MKLALIIAAALLPACSVHHAMNVPPPVEYKQIGTGDQKVEVVGLLGAPKYSQKKVDSVVDYYEFKDGYHGASKLRILPYIAAGIFTAGLSEIVFYPLEAALIDGQECKATITYDLNDTIKAYEISTKDGKMLWTNNKPIPSTVQTKKP